MTAPAIPANLRGATSVIPKRPKIMLSGPLVSFTGVAARGPGGHVLGESMGVNKVPRIVNGVTHWLCPHCNQWLTEQSFHRTKLASNGLQSRCIGCQAEANQKWRDANRAALRAKGKRYRADLNTRMPGHLSRKAGLHSKMYPEKVAARNAIAYAIRMGRVERPGACEVCGATGRLFGHHDSYDRDRRLVVSWLCAPCHSDRHRGCPP